MKTPLQRQWVCGVVLLRPGLQLIDDPNHRRTPGELQLLIVEARVCVIRIGEPTVADSICDRLVHGAHRIELQRESVQKRRAALTKDATSDKRVLAPHAPSSGVHLRQNARPPSPGNGRPCSSETAPRAVGVPYSRIDEAFSISSMPEIWRRK